MNTSALSPDGNRTKPSMSVRFYRMQIKRSLREGNISSLCYLLLCLLIRWNDYTHVSLCIQTQTSHVEYSLSWFGVYSNPPRDDYTLEVRVPQSVKEFHGFYGCRTYVGYLHATLTRLQKLSEDSEYFCSIQQIVSTWMSTKFKRVKPGPTCVQLVCKAMNLPKRDTYTPEQLLTLLLAMGCKEMKRI